MPLQRRQPSAGFQGQSTDIGIHAQEILESRRRIEKIYAVCTGQSERQIHEDMDRDRFFTTEQAREYGLIDGVLEGRGTTLTPVGFGG
jgi:ATP-dependent Clp protease protease subunit